jgi:hypothetical protein
LSSILSDESGFLTSGFLFRSTAIRHVGQDPWVNSVRSKPRAIPHNPDNYLDSNIFMHFLSITGFSGEPDITQLF